MSEEADIKALRKRAMYDPESLSKHDWDIIYKVATSVPKSESSNEPVIRRKKQQPKKGSWW